MLAQPPPTESSPEVAPHRAMTTSEPPGARSRGRKPVDPAETGRPETSREFAKRIRRVVLHGPHAEQQEGVRPTNELARDNVLDEKYSSHDPEIVQPAVQFAHGFMQHLSESTDGLDLLAVLKGRYGEDQFFARILENPKHFKNFDLQEGLVFIRDANKCLLCIPKVLINGRSAREIVIRHAHSILAHLGTHRTLCLLRDHVWWKS
ncbi:hypothetical protein L227DRAFT_515427, partial [Lentinus tigrinus ALCF2SS1-6]